MASRPTQENNNDDGTVLQFLKNRYGIDPKPGQKSACPLCGHKTLSVKRDGSLAKCHHPGCSFLITAAQLRDQRASYLQRVLELIFGATRDHLHDLARESTLNAYHYCVKERAIHPQVVRDAMLGAVPTHYDVAGPFKAVMDELDSDNPEHQAIAGELLNQQTGLAKLFAARAGDLLFYMTDDRGRITSLQFRRPYTKDILTHKFGSRSGCFGLPLYHPSDYAAFTGADRYRLIFEGPFNVLALQSLIAYQERQYVNACAVGGVDAADIYTARRGTKKVVVIYDNDASGAGLVLVQRFRELGEVESCTTPGPDSDLDSHIRSFGTDYARAWESVSEIIKGRRAQKQLFKSIFGEDGGIIPLAVARQIGEEHCLISIDGNLHEYERGCYRPKGPVVYEQQALNMVGAAARRNLLGDIMKLLTVDTAIDAERVYRAGRVLNLSNCLLDLEAGAQARPHTPDHLSIYQLPHAYQPEAQCPIWLMFLAESFPDETDIIDFLQEWAGYLLILTTHLHKALVFYGMGGEGKSVVAHVFKKLAGDANTSAISLTSLSRPFALAELYGKLLNVTVEADIRDGIDEANFKALVAGDPIQAERKFRDPFTFTNVARFLICTNNLFHVDDRTDGFYRRLIIIRFKHQVAEANQDPNLSVKLEAELPGILNWALAGLERLEKRGQFNIPQSVRDEVSAYRRMNDPVSLWLEECCETGNPKYNDTGRDLYRSYRSWASDNGHRPLSSTKFGMEMKRLGFKSERAPDKKTRIVTYYGLYLIRELKGE